MRLTSSQTGGGVFHPSQALNLSTFSSATLTFCTITHQTKAVPLKVQVITLDAAG